MKATIDVESRKEADLIKTALDDPTTRAIVQILGALLPLSPRARTRVMQFVTDRLDEEKQSETGQG